jgi:hypothetical protein
MTALHNQACVFFIFLDCLFWGHGKELIRRAFPAGHSRLLLPSLPFRDAVRSLPRALRTLLCLPLRDAVRSLPWVSRNEPNYRIPMPGSPLRARICPPRRPLDDCGGGGRDVA